MDGLTEQADSGVVFDKPDGRIVERYASGPLTTDSVVAFYKETLPQLGWQAATGQGPTISLSSARANRSTSNSKRSTSELVVRFSVAPG